jgi:hypothetical protein
VVSRADLNKFLSGARKLVAEREIAPEDRKKLIAEYLGRFKPAVLHQLFARAYIDALKSPSQKVGRSAASKRARQAKKPGRSDGR